ncbi:uncharacterized protein LOC128715991 [Anopheles marshallii]|uniref:uncharacterized protein LOC128715991 n=1 Tax=Anopheles marshallii TaxID=1521116 RepID=UPI00237B3165|nr:uncharacterized protein LOC128715991 [Anopheles marshallii]
MDIYYMSDSIQYSSFRGPVYRDYEKFPYGTLENPLNNPVSKTKQQQQQRRHHSNASGSSSAQAKLLSYIGKSASAGKSSKDACPFCKEQKKRPLGAYMRKRGQRITTESISEDAEECIDELREEDEEEDMCASARGTTLSTSPTGNHHQHITPAGAGFNRQESIESK